MRPNQTASPPQCTATDPSARQVRLWLASRSPRRQAMLREAGLNFVAAHPGLEDSMLLPGQVDPRAWVAALAYLKAATAIHTSAFGDRAFDLHDVVIGADTAIIKGDRLIGTPESNAQATEILRSLRNGSHAVVSGLALLHPASNRRELLWDIAEVTVGPLSDEAIARYVRTDGWRGKAGGYNLNERIADGWPITYHGSDSTIMGLPMPRLLERLRAWSSTLDA